MSLKLSFAAFVISTFCMAQSQRAPDLQVQREAMKKLNFLVGRWAGEARLLRGPGQWVTVVQTEEAQYKLDGLILVIEGVGRATTESAPLLQALGVISYDDQNASYHMRAFNDGRFLESEVKLLDDGKGMTWGFSLGEIKTSSTLRITQNGDWTESAEITFASRSPQKLMELTVRRRK
jgi:hypothetical protein